MTKKPSLTSEIKELKETNKKYYDLLVSQNQEIVKLIHQISVLQSVVTMENKEFTSTLYVPGKSH